MPVCPRCSTAVGSAEDFLGGCPRCLLGWAVEAHGDPESIGGYRILGRLGLGGMGIVYRALHPELRREVALKLLAAGEDADRFLREARAAAKLSHPGIVPIYDVGRHEGRPFFVMEKVDGGPLAGPMPPRDAARILAEAARALHHAHRAGIVHRDVKPTNILLGSDGRPRIADFGVARDLARATQVTTAGVIVGTPSYMAPEQIEGASGPSVDVFALGATLYECLTGRAAFRGIERPEPSRPGGPRDLEIICLKALEKDPARRYPSCEALADDLERFVRGDAILARPPSPLVRFARAVRRRAVTITIVASLGFALAMALRPRPAAPLPPPDETAARELFAEAGMLTAPSVAEKRHRLLYEALRQAKSDPLVRRIEDRLGRGDAFPWFALALTGQVPALDGPPELKRATETLEVEDARRAIENDPNSWRAWLVLVVAHLRDGNPAEARESARRARLLAPELRAAQAFEALALRARWLFAGTEEADPLTDRADPVVSLAAAVLPRVEVDREGRVSFLVEDPPDAIGAVPPELEPLRAWARLSFGQIAEPADGSAEWREFVTKLRAANDRTPWFLYAQARRGDVEANVTKLLEVLDPGNPWQTLAYRYPALVLLAESRLARGDREGAKAALVGVPPTMIEGHPALQKLNP